MDDMELKKLLESIAPPIDESAKTRSLNEAQSAFEALSKKSEKKRQGISAGSRLTGVIHHLLGVNPMKKSYIVLGTLAFGALAISLVTTTSLMQPDFLQEKTFTAVSGSLGGSGIDKDSYNQPATTPIAPTEQEAMRVDEVAGGAANMPTPSSPPMLERAEAKAKQTPAKPKQTESRMAMDSMVGNYAGAPSSAYTGALVMAPEIDMAAPQQQYFGNDKFETVKENPVKVANEEPVSTFSIDVDTASYSFVRSALGNGTLPQKDAVRIEELINYFDYDYATPESKAEPFKPTIALYDTPWNKDTILLHVGIKGHEMNKKAEKPHSNLVFLLDVSGSMNEPAKLPLLKNAFRMLVDTLQPDDMVSIVVYAGAAGTVLEPTKVSDKAKILSALENLNAGGSTAGGEGIRQAYQLAESNFDKSGVNRVILATDGDFNVGITDEEQLKDLIERKRDTGIYLSVLGFGRGNYNDELMQTLAQNGNGNAAYIDSLNEARKVLVEEATSTLYPIANDVKIQVEFNPAAVSEYRLIGYETRLLNREDFNNDKVDAGDIGAGHTVTAIYELTPTGSKAKLVDDLRYGSEEAKKEAAPKGDNKEFGFLKLRYKLPGEKVSKLIEKPITIADKTSVDKLSDDVRFAGAVAAFGQLLRDETYTKNYTFDDVLNLATSARGVDEFGYRSEFLNLVRLAKTASDQQSQPEGNIGVMPAPVMPYGTR